MDDIILGYVPGYPQSMCSAMHILGCLYFYVPFLGARYERARRFLGVGKCNTRVPKRQTLPLRTRNPSAMCMLVFIFLCFVHFYSPAQVASVPSTSLSASPSGHGVFTGSCLVLPPPRACLHFDRAHYWVGQEIHFKGRVQKRLACWIPVQYGNSVVWRCFF